ncbi:MAG: hypothetical protein V5A55_12375 [Halovenus sp.]
MGPGAGADSLVDRMDGPPLDWVFLGGVASSVAGYATYGLVVR